VSVCLVAVSVFDSILEKVVFYGCCIQIVVYFFNVVGYILVFIEFNHIWFVRGVEFDLFFDQIIVEISESHVEVHFLEYVIDIM